MWKGEYEGNTYADQGEILEVEPERRLKVSRFSPLSGQADVPDNYHTLIYELTQHGDKTHLSLSQDKNASEEEAERARGNWEMMLGGRKKVDEGG